MKRASYRDAVDWIAQNDSADEDSEVLEAVSSLVSTCLVADIFGVNREKVGSDIIKRRQKLSKMEN
jgi:hypothetical protein